MSRTLTAALILGVFLHQAAGVGAGEERYSGTVTAVGPSGRSITLKEVGIGVGRGRNSIVERPIMLKPETEVILATRAEDDETLEWPGGFKESPLAATDLRPGDYATVEAQSENGRLVAVSILVVRPVTEPR
jgi:hypothetical protein